jgi:hypothetical protein
MLVGVGTVTVVSMPQCGEERAGRTRRGRLNNRAYHDGVRWRNTSGDSGVCESREYTPVVALQSE